MRILLCPMSDPGFLFPAIAVGRELHRRGHHLTLAGRPSAAGFAADGGLEFHPAAPDDVFGNARWFLDGALQYRAALDAARNTRPDVVVTSVLCHGALLAAETLGLPVAVIGLAAHLWPYRSGADAEPPMKDSREWRVRDMAARLGRLREELGFVALDDRACRRALLGDALLLRGDPELEFPGAVLPERVHQVGPCWWEPAAAEADLADIDRRLARRGKHVAYVHLARNFNHPGLWPQLARLFTDTPWQAVVELGRTDDPPQPSPAHEDLHVVRRPWMGPLIERADVVLTNGTTAPVLGALLHRRPLLVSPTGGEQLVLAAACLRAGVARELPEAVESPDPAGIMRAVTSDTALHARVEALGEKLANRKSEARAADVVERLGS